MKDLMISNEFGIIVHELFLEKKNKKFMDKEENKLNDV
jgi:hypothetical protein